MKLLLCNDLHIDNKAPANRTDDFLTIQHHKLEWLFGMSRKCGAILCGGDFTNRPNISNKMISTLQGMLYTNSAHLYTVPGQHDLMFRNYSELDDTALGIMASSRLLTIMSPDFSYHIGENVFVQACGWGQKLPQHAYDPDVVNILVIHASIGDKKLFPDMKLTPAGAFLKEHKQFDLILCGDYHYPFHLRVKSKRTGKVRQILNCGTLIRRKSNEKDIVPKVAVYDTQTGELSFHRYLATKNPFNETKAKDTPTGMVESILANLRVGKTLATDYKESVLRYLGEQSEVSPEVEVVIRALLDKAEEATNAKG